MPELELLEQWPPLDVGGETYDFSPLTRISDADLLRMIACTGVRAAIDVEDLERVLENDKLYDAVENPHTHATFWRRTEPVRGKNGGDFEAVLARDLDNSEIGIYPEGGDSAVVRLRLRDRSHDGTFGATPPGFLAATPPGRSHLIGATRWAYSHPEKDKQLAGRQSVEISRGSSDPERLIAARLEEKPDKLFPGVTPGKLAEFIDDPFKALPLQDPSEATLTEWYKLWWQVVNRGMRDKWIAYPGQSSERGFKHFSDHVHSQLPKPLQGLGYSHISSVPTWAHVWKANVSGRDFHPDHEDQHSKAERFFAALGSVAIPRFEPHAVESSGSLPLGTLNDRDPLHSWLAVVPFAVALNPELQPDLGIGDREQAYFDTIFRSLKQQVMQEDTVLTYPLSPGNNLWYSKVVA